MVCQVCLHTPFEKVWNTLHCVDWLYSVSLLEKHLIQSVMLQIQQIKCLCYRIDTFDCVSDAIHHQQLIPPQAFETPIHQRTKP